MKNKKFLIVSFIVFFALLFFTISCNNSIQEKQNISKIKLIIGSQNDARSWLPVADTNISNFSLTLSKGTTIITDSFSASQASWDSPNLETGTWNLNILGFNSSNEAIVQGTTSFSISKGETKTVYVNLDLVKSNGSLEIIANIDSQFSLELEMKDSKKALQSLPDLELNTDGNLYLTKNFAAGYYYLTITLKEGENTKDSLIGSLQILSEKTTTVAIDLFPGTTLLNWNANITSNPNGSDPGDDGGHDFGSGLIPYSLNPSYGQYIASGLTIDGSTTSKQWSNDNLIAIDMANDDPRTLGEGNWSMHETPWDLTHLWAAWDDEGLYLAWQYVDVTDVIDPANEGSSAGTKPIQMDLIQWIALDLYPNKGSHYDMWEKNGGEKYWNGSDLPDFQIYLASNLTQGYYSKVVDGQFVVQDAPPTEDYKRFVSSGGYNWEQGKVTGINILVDGFEIGAGLGLVADSLWGVEKAHHALEENPELIDMLEEGHDGSRDTFYEIKIPYSVLGIDKNYIETNGIGVMLGQGEFSAIDTIPHDNETLMYAGVTESNSPVSWETTKTFTTPFARIGKAKQ